MQPDLIADHARDHAPGVPDAELCQRTARWLAVTRQGTDQRPRPSGVPPVPEFGTEVECQPRGPRRVGLHLAAVVASAVLVQQGCLHLGVPLLEGYAAGALTGLLVTLAPEWCARLKEREALNEL